MVSDFTKSQLEEVVGSGSVIGTYATPGPAIQDDDEGGYLESHVNRHKGGSAIVDEGLEAWAKWSNVVDFVGFVCYPTSPSSVVFKLRVEGPKLGVPSSVMYQRRNLRDVTWGDRVLSNPKESRVALGDVGPYVL